MAGVRAVGLRAPLVPAPRRGFRRLGQMHHRADRAQLLDEKPPAGGRLERDLQLLAREPLKEPAHPDPVRRSDPRATDLAAAQIDPLSGDLRPMLVNTHHYRHPTNLPTTQGQPPTSDPSNTLVGGRCLLLNGRPRGCNPRAPTYAVRHEGPGHLPAAGLTRRPGNDPGHDIFRRSGTSILPIFVDASPARPPTPSATPAKRRDSPRGRRRAGARLDDREAVRVLVCEDWSKHDHVATPEIRPPAGSMAVVSAVKNCWAQVRPRRCEPVVLAKYVNASGRRGRYSA